MRTARHRTERRDEVERALERARPKGEVPRGDGGREAVVEGLGDPERGMHAVPAGLKRQLVRPQHARVEQAEQLDIVEDALAEGPELLGAVLLQVPWVVGLVRTRWGEREQVGRRDERDPARPQELAKVAQHRLGIGHVLDRLKEDDGVAGLRVALHQVTHEAHARTRVLEARVLVGLRVGVDAGDLSGAAGPARPRRSPRRRPYRPRRGPGSARPPTHTPPGGAGTSSSRRARRAACARPSARAAARPRVALSGPCPAWASQSRY